MPYDPTIDEDLALAKELLAHQQIHVGDVVFAYELLARFVTEIERLRAERDDLRRNGVIVCEEDEPDEAQEPWR